MNKHVLFVTNPFYVAACATALPSLPAFLYFGWAAMRLRMLSPASSAGSGASSDSLTGLIELAWRIFGSAFRALGAAGQFVTTALAGIFVAVLLVAAGLFFTARGLQAHAGWARVLASLFLVGMLLISFVAMLSVRRGLFPIFASMVAASVYAIWVLARKF